MDGMDDVDGLDGMRAMRMPSSGLAVGWWWLVMIAIPRQAWRARLPFWRPIGRSALPLGALALPFDAAVNSPFMASDIRASSASWFSLRLAICSRGRRRPP